jgi:AraC family ethanolamine operon transcriptional activator
VNRDLIIQRYDDFDFLQETIRAWDLDFHQIEQGPFDGVVAQRTGDRIETAYARFDRALEQSGSPPPASFTFAIPAARCTPFWWRNQRINVSRIAMFRPGGELDAVSAAGFEIFTLSIPERTLDELNLEQSPKEVTSVPPVALDRLRKRIVEFLRAPATGDEPPDRLVLAALRDCLAGGSVPSTARELRRRELMGRCLALLDRNPRRPVSVGDLARTLGVNERTLRRAFRDRFGIAPKAYLTSRRLNGARRELRSASHSAVRVADVARSWGFGHAGEFSVRYKAQFGESPSETLGRRPGAG